MTDIARPLTFAGDGELTFIDNPSPVTFAVDQERRTIRGFALPFGDIGDNGWAKWSFAKGTVTWAKAKALDNHNRDRAFGTTQFTEAEDGIYFAMRVAPGPRGDEMLALATPDPETGEAAYDGVSVGLGTDVEFVERDGVRHITRATLIEASLTPFPAFGRASVTSVAASANQKGNTVKCSKCNTIHAEGVVSCEAPEATSFSAESGAALAKTVEALDAQVKSMAAIKVPVADVSTFAVKEEPIYRFNGTTPAPSGFDFATDIHAAAMRGDGAALARVQTFTGKNLGPRFVDSGDVSQVNPATYRPDMFLGQAPVPQSPMFDTFRKGDLANITPFFYSRLDRAETNAGVANHVEGVDPTAKDVKTAVGDTVTPSAVSGKVHLTREVGDQGGNPQVSGLIWNEFERSFSIALEAKTNALVAAAAGSVTALCTIAPGANGAVAGLAIESGLLALQFLPDGTRFTKAFGHVDLYTALATYENSEGEKRYPIINPQNRSGIAGAKYSFLDLAGYRMEPGTSLGTTSPNASNSWVADPYAVHVWNSGLTRFDKLQETVEGWDIGCFAYFAGIVYDATGLRKIAYDPAA